MEEVWLSIIVPSHNGQRRLAIALQSIADQKDPGIEVIAIDSSADDASLASIERGIKNGEYLAVGDYSVS
jgi:glycosyltransferase involved in cell wall biosynthesis